MKFVLSRWSGLKQWLSSLRLAAGGNVSTSPAVTRVRLHSAAGRSRGPLNGAIAPNSAGGGGCGTPTGGGGSEGSTPTAVGGTAVVDCGIGTAGAAAFSAIGISSISWAAADSVVANVTFVGAVMCAAYYAANNPTDDKDDGDDDRCHPPSRAIPW